MCSAVAPGVPRPALLSASTAKVAVPTSISSCICALLLVVMSLHAHCGVQELVAGQRGSARGRAHRLSPHVHPHQQHVGP